MSASFKIDEILKATGGKLVSTVSDSCVGVGTDTRKDLSGQLFVALKGDIFDAHKFIPQAVQSGASIILSHSEEYLTEDVRAKVSTVLVDDTLLALQKLATYYRRRVNPRVVAITGSNGKTSAKEFTAQVLKGNTDVHWSKGSFNNHWGVPLSLLAMPEGSKVAVLEMGMNNYKEISRLVEIAEPNVVTVTNVGRAHFGFFGSLENIAIAKKEIYDHASDDAIRIFNLDNKFTKIMFEENKSSFQDKCFAYSRSDSDDVCVSLNLEEHKPGHLVVAGRIENVESRVKVPLFGKHNIENIMAAATVALKLGLDPQSIWDSLSSLETAWGRSQWLDGPRGSKILFDGYNSNPDSCESLLTNLRELKSEGPSQFIGVFGEMLELGEESQESHKSLGGLVGAMKFNKVWFYGPSETAFYEGFVASDDDGKLVTSTEFDPEIAHRISELGNANTIYVLKGSRGMAVEKVFPDYIPKKPY